MGEGPDAELQASTSVKGKDLALFQVLGYTTTSTFLHSACLPCPYCGRVDLPEAILALHTNYCKAEVEGGRCTC